MGKTAVVFVHGFGSNRDCWSPFLNLLQADPAFREGYDFQCCSYETRWFNWNPLTRIPRLEELGDALRQHMERRCGDCTDWILVGHSQGGLVIQSYLQDRIAAHRGMDLARIRSAILFATPNLGSDVFTGLRRVVSRFSPNPQERALRVLNPSIADMSRVIQRDILQSASAGSDSCPIPFQAFWGREDRVVPEASARGYFSETASLPGDHFSIIRPEGSDAANDDRYLALRDAILNPVGHPATWEIERFEARLEVSPYPSTTPYMARYGDRTREIATDNRARRLFEITFSAGNRCEKLFTIFYRTRNEGFVREVSIRQPNRAAPSELSTYLETGTILTYSFAPQPNEKFWSDVEIYKGFDAGQRDWHHHLPKESHCRLFRFTLDLSAYYKAGYEIALGPFLRILTDNVDGQALCAERPIVPPQQALPQTVPGVWVWELHDVRGAALDLVWDIAEKAQAGA